MHVTYRKIPGFPAYKAGTDGSIWSCYQKGPGSYTTNKWRKLNPHREKKMGYLQVQLRQPGNNRIRLVHTIILEVFVGPRPHGKVARHFPDRDPANCALSNLVWGTYEQNCEDRKRDGNDQIGTKNINAKITEEDVRTIRSATYRGAVAEMARIFGLSKPSVIAIRKFRTWKHVT